MLSNVIKKNWEENKGTYIKAGLLIGAGFLIGCRYQRGVDVKNLAASIKAGKALIPNMADSLLPTVKSATTIAEIKNIAHTLPITSISDAVVATIGGQPLLFVR